MVVSATPREALEREWTEHGLIEHVALIAGQELGSKKEHLLLAAGGRYEPDKILMVGRRPRRLEAARHAGAALLSRSIPATRTSHGSDSLRKACPDSSPGISPGITWTPSSIGSWTLLPERPPWNTPEPPWSGKPRRDPVYALLGGNTDSAGMAIDDRRPSAARYTRESDGRIELAAVVQSVRECDTSATTWEFEDSEYGAERKDRRHRTDRPGGDG